jgi:hypothetical protein
MHWRLSVDRGLEVCKAHVGALGRRTRPASLEAFMKESRVSGCRGRGRAEGREDSTYGSRTDCGTEDTACPASMAPAAYAPPHDLHAMATGHRAACRCLWAKAVRGSPGRRAGRCRSVIATGQPPVPAEANVPPIMKLAKKARTSWVYSTITQTAAKYYRVASGCLV